MRTCSILFLALAALALPACGGDESSGEPAYPADWPSEEARTLQEGHLPTPFTAAQIRAGCPPGLRITSLVKSPAMGNSRHIFSFGKSDDVQTEFTFTEVGEDGKALGVPRSAPRTWLELQRHASLPVEHAKLTLERITVPAGTYDCMRYDIARPNQRGGENQEILWFAFEMPGPPIRWVKKLGDETVVDMELLEREIVK